MLDAAGKSHLGEWLTMKTILTIINIDYPAFLRKQYFYEKQYMNQQKLRKTK